jgi:hypothetical protein
MYVSPTGDYKVCSPRSQYLAATVQIELPSMNFPLRWDRTDETNVLVSGNH